MKLFVIEEFGVEHHVVLGIYTDRILAEKDFQFYLDDRISDCKKFSDSEYRTRFVKYGDFHYGEQCQFAGEAGFQEWVESGWAEEHGSSLHKNLVLKEVETREDLSLQDKINKINAWQQNSMVHQLTCGKDSSHPALEPFLYYYNNDIGIRCTQEECGWEQNSDHSIFKIIYNANSSKRPQAE